MSATRPNQFGAASDRNETDVPGDKRVLVLAPTGNDARLICICSPAGQEKFFLEVGVPVATRTTAPPKLDKDQQQQFMEKAKALAPKYHTELLKEA